MKVRLLQLEWLTQEYVIMSFLKILKWSAPFAPWIQNCMTNSWWSDLNRYEKNRRAWVQTSLQKINEKFQKPLKILNSQINHQPAQVEPYDRICPSTTYHYRVIDFSSFRKKIPSFFLFILGLPQESDPASVAPHNASKFYLTNSAMITGIKAMLGLTKGYKIDP